MRGATTAYCQQLPVARGRGNRASLAWNVPDTIQTTPAATVHRTMQHRSLPYSARVRAAMQLAEKEHRGVNRKSGDVPYLLHPVAVANSLSAVGAEDDLVIAGYLHDVVEDTDVPLIEIEDRFGSNVARLVGAVTKPAVGPDGQPLDKATLIALTEQKMSVADADVAALKGADLLTNMGDLVLDQQEEGYSHWRKLFKTREKAEQKINHYLRLNDILIGRLAATQSYPELADHLRQRSQQLRTLFDNWEDYPNNS